MNAIFYEVIDCLKNCAKKYFENNVVIHIEILSYSFRRLSELLKIKVIFSDGNYKNYYIKIIRNPRLSNEEIRRNIDNEYQITKFLEQKYENYKDFSVLKIIAFFPEWNCMVTEECQGEAFSSIINRYAKLYSGSNSMERLNCIASNCGNWLKLFQKFTRKTGKFNLDLMIDYVDVRLKILVENPLSGLENKLRSQLIQYFKEQKKKVLEESNLSLTVVHGDFGPSNILVNFDKIIGMDLNVINVGSVYHDITRFYFQLELLLYKPIIFRSFVINQMQNSFLNCFADIIRKSDTLFKLFIIQHTLCHFVGISRLNEFPFHERLYNRRICKIHLKNLLHFLSNK